MLSPRLERLVQLLVIYSVVMLIVEIDWTSAEHSHAAPPFFLWSERLVALFFTFEMVLRWQSLPHATFTEKLRTTFGRPEGWFDVLAILPFWLGFFLPAEALSVVRTTRVFRLAKLYRYSPTAHAIVAALWRAREKIRVVGVMVLMTVLFGSLVMYELERKAQPEAFGSVADSAWWCVVTVTTVGYGDVSPVTPLGKVVAAFLMPFVLAVMGAFIGIVGGAFQDVADEPE
ncbi:MAG: ion transporter [Acidobacteriota bacterium]